MKTDLHSLDLFDLARAVLAMPCTNENEAATLGAHAHRLAEVVAELLNPNPEPPAPRPPWPVPPTAESMTPERREWMRARLEDEEIHVPGTAWHEWLGSALLALDAATRSDSAAAPATQPTGEPITFTYRNHRGEFGERRVIPFQIRYGTGVNRPEPGWLLDAWCLDRGAMRSFTLANLNIPANVVLHCPRCFAQHIDAPEPETGWTNPVHRSHTCHACGLVFRHSDTPTNGVASATTRGKADSPAEDLTVSIEDVSLEKVLRLDGEATDGPWEYDGSRCVYVPEHFRYPDSDSALFVGHWKPNAALIAYYRTAAPALARALIAERQKLNDATREAREEGIRVGQDTAAHQLEDLLSGRPLGDPAYTEPLVEALRRVEQLLKTPTPRRIVCDAHTVSGRPRLEGTRLYLTLFTGLTREQVEMNWSPNLTDAEWEAVSEWLASPEGERAVRDEHEQSRGR